MTGQIDILFDRETGESVWTGEPFWRDNKVSCVIDSIAPLPLRDGRGIVSQLPTAAAGHGSEDVAVDWLGLDDRYWDGGSRSSGWLARAGTLARATWPMSPRCPRRAFARAAR